MSNAKISFRKASHSEMPQTDFYITRHFSLMSIFYFLPKQFQMRNLSLHEVWHGSCKLQQWQHYIEEVTSFYLNRICNFQDILDWLKKQFQLMPPLYLLFTTNSAFHLSNSESHLLISKQKCILKLTLYLQRTLRQLWIISLLLPWIISLLLLWIITESELIIEKILI